MRHVRRQTVCAAALILLCHLTSWAAAADAPAAAPGAKVADSPAAPAGRPNIVLLLVDDWRWDTLGCAGNPIVKTPRIDALAARGVRFTQARVTTSICGVSRASLLTGQWMSRHGNRGFAAFNTPWAQTYPGALRQAGYWTGHVGKWHCGPFPKDGFDSGVAYAGRHFLKGKAGDPPVHVTEKNERDALAFLQQRPKDEPFCLTVAFFAAHAEDNNPKQFLYQPKSESLYADVKIPVPPTATDAHFRALPPFLATEKNEGRRRWHWRFDTPEKYQQMMRAYYRLVSEVDAATGRIVDALEADGTLDNTLIVFTSDNGYFHGERGLADKWYPYEEALRVPLIVVDPRLPKAHRGTTRDEFVLNVDVAPTLLAAADVAAPAGMQGRDFAPLYTQEQPVTPPWRDAFYYEHAVVIAKDRIPASEAIVRRDLKYIHWPDFAYDELFDLKQDPREERNLAADPAHAAKLATLRKEMVAWRERVR